MINHDVVSGVSTYFQNLSEDVFPDDLKNRATVVLSGSAGWGIAEGLFE
ncbi:hypothetical protein [Baia soyae]|nr:hypothetical protein [Baia soyae]